MTSETIVIKGAGVTGLCCAVALLEHGFSVVVEDVGGQVGSGASWQAGGMLAPWCESEASQEPLIEIASGSLEWWCRRVPATLCHGTLVVAAARDHADLARFARRTSGHVVVDAEQVGQMEPALAGRFGRGLFFQGEGHLDPRDALHRLSERVSGLGGMIRLNTPDLGSRDRRLTIDASGLGAANQISGLRGVRGEMMLVRCTEMSLARPVRLLHPRHPIYVVPRGGSIFMIGATMIETENAGPMTVRSAMDLLATAYALHPVFGDAEILEFGAGVRPTLPDHMPELRWQGDTLFANGMYRHGFLLGPIIAEQAVRAVTARIAAR